jgi:hypothetical protein
VRAVLIRWLQLAQCQQNDAPRRKVYIPVVWRRSCCRISGLAKRERQLRQTHDVVSMVVDLVIEQLSDALSQSAKGTLSRDTVFRSS